MELLQNQVDNDPSVVGKKVHEQFYLDIPKQLQHYWSPELRVSLEEDEEEEKGTIIRCILGPSYTVWVMFVFLYTLLGVISLFGGMYGLVQWSLGHPTLWVWCMPITLVILAGVYLTAKIGQGKGRDEMLHLVSVLYHALKDGDIKRIES
jgi:hypothetical protein